MGSNANFMEYWIMHTRLVDYYDDDDDVCLCYSKPTTKLFSGKAIILLNGQLSKEATDCVKEHVQKEIFLTCEALFA